MPPLPPTPRSLHQKNAVGVGGEGIICLEDFPIPSCFAGRFFDINWNSLFRVYPMQEFSPISFLIDNKNSG